MEAWRPLLVALISAFFYMLASLQTAVPARLHQDCRDEYTIRKQSASSSSHDVCNLLREYVNCYHNASDVDTTKQEEALGLMSFISTELEPFKDGDGCTTEDLIHGQPPFLMKVVNRKIISCVRYIMHTFAGCLIGIILAFFNRLALRHMMGITMVFFLMLLGIIFFNLYKIYSLTAID
ncbi:unnamed protein product [Lymnaea stagnalis]|uniref:Chloride channel CLIC-like protein 1 n=1 Tax=Lymnaea stagnalis TaxID=6523 RepID=A0AAV2HN30_LYMST